MTRSFKYRLYPNARQAAMFGAWFEQCRQIYNAALEQRVTAYKQQGRSLSYIEQQKDLTALRASDKMWTDVSVHAQRSALHRIDRAFVGFFARCMRGEKPGFPRFRSKNQYSSFTLHRGAWSPQHPILSGKRMHVPKIGHVKLDLYRPIAGKIRDVSICRDGARQWWVSFACDVGEVPEKKVVRSMIGIDLGLRSFATLSNGEVISNPRHGVRGQERLARRQRSFDRKQCGSRSHERAAVLVAKAHAHIANQRHEHARKVAKDLFVRFDMVAHEDVKELSLKDLHRGRFSKSFHDVAWGVFIRALALKAERAGAWLVAVDPRWTSQQCSSCGVLVKKALAQRVHRCRCGLTADRDHNAAINILARGSRVLELAQAGNEGEVLLAMPSTEQGRAGVLRSLVAAPRKQFENGSQRRN